MTNFLNTPARVQCPHCKRVNENLETASGEDADLEGAVFACDHCGKRFVVTAVRTITVLSVEAYPR